MKSFLEFIVEVKQPKKKHQFDQNTFTKEFNEVVKNKDKDNNSLRVMIPLNDKNDKYGPLKWVVISRHPNDVLPFSHINFKEKDFMSSKGTTTHIFSDGTLVAFLVKNSDIKFVIDGLGTIIKPISKFPIKAVLCNDDFVEFVRAPNSHIFGEKNKDFVKIVEDFLAILNKKISKRKLHILDSSSSPSSSEQKTMSDANSFAVKPMLAATFDTKSPVDFNGGNWYASKKLDGIRAMIYNGEMYSRTGKLIPNKALRKMFSDEDLHGLDGELIYGDPNAKDVFRDTASSVMTIEGDSKGIYFYVFDDFLHGGPYTARLESIKSRVKNLQKKGIPIQLVDSIKIKNEQHFAEICAKNLKDGYEGSMIRRGDKPYKNGRSTLKEGGLLKVKEFVDSEAIIEGFDELIHLDGSFGNTLGSIICRDIKTGIVFNIGTGFNHSQRDDIWSNKEKYVGKVVSYKSFPSGGKIAPRFPVFLRIRHDADLSM
jgi:DNA ligase 1